jgi:hypothetical protein
LRLGPVLAGEDQIGQHIVLAFVQQTGELWP